MPLRGWQDRGEGHSEPMKVLLELQKVQPQELGCLSQTDLHRQVGSKIFGIRIFRLLDMRLPDRALCESQKEPEIHSVHNHYPLLPGPLDDQHLSTMYALDDLLELLRQIL